MLVEAIELGGAMPTRQIGGTTYNYLPVIIGGNVAHVQLRAAALAANTKCYVQIERGVFLDSGGALWLGTDLP